MEFEVTEFVGKTGLDRGFREDWETVGPSIWGA